MLVKEVISLAAANLGREDLIKCAASQTQPSGELLSLLRCYNLVENEIALDYHPLKREETLSVEGNRVEFSAFTFAPVDILSVTDERGAAVEYSLFPAYIALNCGKEVRISYAYSPAEKGWNDEGSFSGKISARLLSFGVTCEFCLSRGQFSEAAVWQKRYQDALRAASYAQPKKGIRSRRWV